MADHAHDPAEQERKDRLFVTVVVLSLALIPALMSWKGGAAAPAPDSHALPGGAAAARTLQVEGEGGAKPTLYTGLVLQRGATIHVVQASGDELVIPRGAGVEVVDPAKASTEAPVKVAVKVAAAPKRAPAGRSGQGFLVNVDGDAFRGRLEERPATILVVSADRQTIEIPRSEVRWFKFGVNKPDSSYYAAFPNQPVKGFPGPGGDDERLSRAINEFTLGNWAQATRLYVELHLAGHEVSDDLARAARRWSETGSMSDRRSAVRAIGALARAHREDRLLERLCADALYKLGKDASTRGFPREAREVAKELRELGADHAPKAQEIEDELQRRFGDR